jgi:hypothetical protein
MAEFHTPQKISARKMLKEFMNKRYGILKAYCQAGKTGAYHCLIAYMLLIGMVKRVYILCGSAETELRDQATEDAIEYRNKYYKNFPTATILFQKAMEKSVKENITYDFTESLIILDESHLVCTQGQTVDKFFAKHGLSVTGDQTPYLELNSYFLSVSATPYSELAAFHNKESIYSKNKFVASLGVEEGYIGLREFNRRGCFKSTFDFTLPENYNRFLNILKETTNKYFLIRLSPNHMKTKKFLKQMNVIERCVAELGGCVRNFLGGSNKNILITHKQKDMKRGAEHMTCLEDAPTCLTVVVLQGCLRVGKVVPKQHIGAIWECSMGAKTDVIVQGLVGRMCGYYTHSTDTLPSLYVPRGFLEHNEKKLHEMSELEIAENCCEDALPAHANHVKPPKKENKRQTINNLHETVPLGIPCPDREVEGFSSTKSSMNAITGFNFFTKNIQYMMNYMSYTEEQKDEIQRMTFADVSIRHYHKTSTNMNHLKQVIYGARDGLICTEPITEPKGVTVIMPYPDLKEKKELSEDVLNVLGNKIYFIFHTKTPNPPQFYEPSKKELFPGTDGTTTWTQEREYAPPAADADGCIYIPNVSSPDGLKSVLVHMSSLCKSSPGAFAKLRPLYLNKKEYNWESNDQNKNDVWKLIEQSKMKFGVTIHVQFENTLCREVFLVKSLSIKSA